MKNFLMQTFQGKIENKPNANISKDSKEKKIDLQKIAQKSRTNLNTKNTNNKNINKVINKPKLSQEIINSNLAFIGMHPTTQDLTEENNNSKKN